MKEVMCRGIMMKVVVQFLGSLFSLLEKVPVGNEGEIINPFEILDENTQDE